MNAIQLGDFVLRSGKKSPYKIECDAFGPDDWHYIAKLAAARVPPFRIVTGVPRGGSPFARALQAYATPGDPTLPVLVADDVVTTGGSMDRWVKTLIADPQTLWATPATRWEWVAAFGRRPFPDWVTAVFVVELTPPLRAASALAPVEKSYRSCPACGGVGGLLYEPGLFTDVCSKCNGTGRGSV
jgi:hypothetical protein